ncbi:MAG: hypothetical protein AVO35_02760 [Candidatus Aegiribacteria sp. MLS_C]|nr:MAG: hypothetical protein AVO35_02760 [Candidatus Aegiribacteria sp. MLS_C]
MNDGRFYRLGIVGWPLGHSLSPSIHGGFLRSSGLEGEYLAYPLEPSRFEEDLRDVLDGGVCGLNVTFPYKSSAAGVCDRVFSSTAIPVVNTLHRHEGGVSGYNTDTAGFAAMVDRFGLEEPFVVAGAGGAAMAVDGVLHERDMDCRVFCRMPMKWAGHAPAHPMEELEDLLDCTAGGTVVNATTLGWRDGDVFPVGTGAMSGMTFADLNYNRGWFWRNTLERNGTRTVTGEVMLVSQAAESFRIWTGIEPDIEGALEELLHNRKNGD